MKSKLMVVFKKEFRETLRDRRSLVLLALFTLMYPLMLGYMLNKQIERATQPEREGMELAVIGAAQAPNLMAQFKQKNVTVTEVDAMGEEAIGELLKSRKVVAVLRIDDKFTENYQAMRPAQVELWFDSAIDHGPRVRDVEAVLNAYSMDIASARLLAHGVSPVTMAPVKVQRYDTGGTAGRSGVIGAMIGFLFFPAFACCLSAAVDSTAGERERRSMEVLMAQPLRTWELIGGKWLAAGILSVVAITLELALAHGILSWLPLEEVGTSWRVTSADLALICLASVPLSMLAASVHIAMAMNAKSFKEAQTTASVAMLVPMIPGVVVSMMELKTAAWMYAVPMLSNQTLLGEVAKGQDIGAMPYLLTFFSSMVPALAGVAFASWRLRSERYVLAV
ncbi:ABC transporter permease [Massilia sp. GCM10020059]|uniref:ABC transporter permease subunit n=1 Tax=Massilia agrisoli TaxID=2892444 RepID=A0ABS8IQP0_9BURK|nr:ABC transporter permease subunit [Massilia agrisoli]MCC6069610.1 ABC transporter permease subunit [Massilia agrisoli]